MASPPTDPKDAQVYAQLLKVRESKTLSLKPTPTLRTELEGPDGTPVPFNLRYYQSQGIFHLLMCRRMVLGDGTGLGKCQVPGTLIASGGGLRRLDSFAPSGFDFANATEGFYAVDKDIEVWTGQRMAKVPRFYWSGKKPTVKVTTRNGFQLEGTLVHPVRVRTPEGERWVELQGVTEGSFLCVDRAAEKAPFPGVGPSIPFTPPVRGYTYQYPSQLTDDLTLLLAYVVSEGNPRKDGRGVVVTQDKVLNPEPHAEIRDLFQKVFGWDGNHNLKERDVRIVVSSTGIREYLRACGVGDELSAGKSVPWPVMQGTERQVGNFLSAFIEAEGSVAEGGVEVCSASEQMLQELQLLLLRFGIVSTRSEKPTKGYDHMYWRLTFFGDAARIFQEKIGFRSERKRAALAASLTETSNPNKDLVPHAIQEVSGLKRLILEATSRTGANGNRKGSGLKQFGESFQSTLKHILNGHRNPSYQWLQKLLDIAHSLSLSTTPEYEAVLRVVEQGLYYDPVIKVERSEADVMDIEVDDPAHCYVANGILSHNTCQAIGAMAYLWDKDPDLKVLVVCPKSALRQWAGEVARFTHGVQTFIATGSFPQRKAAYEAWARTPKSILVTNYHSLVRDWDAGGTPSEKGPAVKEGYLSALTKPMKLLVTFDECTAFKTPTTKTHQVCKQVSERATRVWGLTATLLKNSLMEGFGIYKVIKPDVFTSKTAFMNDFCVVDVQKLRSGVRIPIIVGYKNLTQFRAVIDPYFYGRPKHMVSNELPALTSREVLCEMSSNQDRKYEESLQGVLELGDGETKDFQETKALTSLIYCQEVVNSLALLRYKEGEHAELDELGAKEEALLDLLLGEFEDEKVIVYTRFETMVTRMTEILKKNKIKSARITGKENAVARKAAQDKFQDVKSDTKVIFITDAGSEAINLQAAGALVFYDSPWSWGNYCQIIGRLIRIGSTHTNVYAIHLVAERPGQKGKKRETIDHATIRALRKKKGFIDQIIGEAAVGALSFDRGESGIRDLLNEVVKSSAK